MLSKMIDDCTIYEKHLSALHLVECARPPCNENSRRFRRRGPRSEEALQRRRRHIGAALPVLLPQGGGPCQSGPDPPSINEYIYLFHCNIRGFTSNSPELEVRLMLMEKRPSIICLTETWLNSFSGAPKLLRLRNHFPS